MARERLRLGPTSLVIEVACNDGYLLRNFKEFGIPCLGVEPTESTARAAESLGITVLREFFGTRVGKRFKSESQQADLLIGNNVYAHVPDINDFTQGMAHAIKPTGVIVLEFPHLLRLLQQTQFDTIYHEHFSYLSLYTVRRIFESCGLRVFDVEELATHGGSLRVYGCHAQSSHRETEAVASVLKSEQCYGMRDLDIYVQFQERANRVKDELVRLLIDQKREGKTVVGYGAAAKGNTLLNYAGIRSDLIRYVTDRSPSKIGKFLPGSRIPVVDESTLKTTLPDWIVLMPWNIADELLEQLAYCRQWGAKFVKAVPKLTTL
jgi:hypothetical protein